MHTTNTVVIINLETDLGVLITLIHLDIIPCGSVKAKIGARSSGECVMSWETKDWDVRSLKDEQILSSSSPQESWVLSAISYTISEP